MKCLIKLFVALLLITPSFAIAQSGNYFGGVNLSNVSYRIEKANNTEQSWSNLMIFFQGGYRLSPIVSLEGRLGLALGDADSLVSDNTQQSFTTTRILGAFVRFGKVGEGFKPYGFLGFSDSELERKNADGVVSDSGNDISGGFGFDYGFDNGKALGMEVVSYYSEGDMSDAMPSDQKARIGSVGVTFSVEF